MDETRASFCRICEASCGLLVDVEVDATLGAAGRGRRVSGIRPDPDHVVSRGFACVKGTSYDEIHHSPDRITQPLKRVGNDFEPISWQNALREIGAKLRALRKRHGPACTGLYAGNPTPFSPLHVIFARAFAVGLATPHIYTSASLDCNNKFAASEEMFGSPILQPIPDIDHMSLFVALGANPVVSNMTFVNAPRILERLKGIEERGGRVVFVNPRSTESVAAVGENLFVRPGTDVYFLLAFARELLALRRIPAHVDDAIVGVAELRNVVDAWAPERVASVTSIPASVVRDLVREFASADGAALYLSTGINQGPHGSLCAWLANAINVVGGHLDRRGGLLVTQAMSHTARLTYPHSGGISHTRSRIGDFRSVFECEPVGLIPAEVRTPGAGQLRALVVTAGNPMLAAPNSGQMEQALGDLELLVCIDLFRNETGNLAHYILPATSFLERDDMPLGITGYQPIPYLQYAEPLVPALDECRDEWWIFTQLARSSGVSLMGSRALHYMATALIGGPGGRTENWRRTCSRLAHRIIAWFYGRSLRELRRHPHGLLMPAAKSGQFLGARVLTKHGQVELAPSSFVREAEKLDPEFEKEKLLGNELRLVTKRERTSHNSWMHNVPRFVKGRRNTNRLVIHPDDAGARSLKDGDLCELRTDAGAIRVPVRVSDEMMPGAVALTHGFGHQQATGLRVARETSGQNYNVLSMDGPESLDALSGMARLTSIAVECRPVSPHHSGQDTGDH